MHHTPAELANIAAPADAQHVAEWVDETGDGQTWGRYIRGTRRAVAGVEVVVAGWQDASGAVEWHASVWATDTQLDAAALRKLAAAAALDTADELARFEAIECSACDRDGMVYDFEGDWRCFHEHDDEQEQLA